jgi:autotransporter-associated beta strand protein
MKITPVAQITQLRYDLAIMAGALFMLMASNLSAQTLVTWSGASGTDANWMTGTNWVGGIAPVTGNVDALDFTGTTGLTNTNNNSGNFSIANITFDSSAGAFDITSLTSTLVLGASSLITDQSTSPEILNANVNIGSGLTINVTNSAGVLEFTGGNISGGHSLTVNGPGTVYLNGAANLYTSSGGTNINSGTLEIGQVTLATATPLGAINRPVNLNGGTLSLDGNTGTLSINNPVSTNTTSTIIVGNATTSLNLTFGNTTTGNATIPGGFSIGNATASPTLNISLPNSASIVSFNGPFGTSNSTLSTGNGMVELGTSSGTIRWNGSGSTSKGGANITFDLGTGSAKMNSGGSTGTISLGALIGGPNTVVSGNTKTAGAIIYQIGNNSLSASTTFAGSITDGTGSNTTALTKIGPAILTLSGSGNSYSGATNISNGTLLLNGSLTHTSAVNINSGGTFEGTGSVTSSGTVTLNSGGKLAPGLGLGTGTLTLPNLTWVAGGTIAAGIVNGSDADAIQLGSGTLTKSGTGVYAFDFGGTTLDTDLTYTLISYGAESGFISSDFSATDVNFGPGFSGAFNLAPGVGSLTFTVSGVPEPAIYGAVLGVVALAFGMLRRRCSLAR